MLAFNIWSHWDAISSSNGPGKEFFTYFLSTNMVHSTFTEKNIFHLEYGPTTAQDYSLTSHVSLIWKEWPLEDDIHRFMALGWGGGFPSTISSKFSPFHWRLSTVLLQLLPVGHGPEIAQDYSLTSHVSLIWKEWPVEDDIHRFMAPNLNLLTAETPTFVFRPIWNLSEWVTAVNSYHKKERQ